MATIAFATGFEHQRASASGGTVVPAVERLWDAILTSPQIDTSNPRTGAACLLISAPASTAEYVSLAMAAGRQRIIGSFYFRISTSLPTGGDFRLLSTSTTAGGQIFLVTTAGVLVAEPAGNAGDRQTGPTVSLNVWYRIDFDFDTSGTQHTIAWSVDGVAQTTATTSDSPGAQDQTNLRIGSTATSHTNAMAVRYDDVVFSYTAGDYPLGEYRVLGYSPNEDVDITQVGAGAFVDAAAVAISGANPAWDNLGTVDGSTTRVEQTVADGAGYIEVGFENSAESTAPDAVMVVGLFSADSATQCNIEARVNDGGTIDNWTGLFDPSDSPGPQRFKTYATKPSGGAWTLAALNALTIRFGFATDATPDPWASGFMFEAAYKVAGLGAPPALTDHYRRSTIIRL